MERKAALAAGLQVLDWSRVAKPPADGTAISTALAEMIQTGYRGYNGWDTGELQEP